jgi:hypothetical protein
MPVSGQAALSLATCAEHSQQSRAARRFSHRSCVPEATQGENHEHDTPSGQRARPRRHVDPARHEAPTDDPHKHDLPDDEAEKLGNFA